MTESKETVAPTKPARSPLRRWSWRIGLAVLAAVLVAGGFYAKWAVLDYRLATVDPGKLYRSAAMPPDHLVKVCRQLGVRTVIDLRTDDEKTSEEAQALEAAGIGHVSLPSHQVPAPETIAGFLKVMDDPKSLPALVHCTHGIGRAGLFSAVYRIEYQKWDNDRARREANFLGGFVSFGVGKPKGRFLLTYEPRRSSGGAAQPQKP